ncbi:MAG: hypothetical protein HOC74_04295 [Gemmatimonadetes bacterium]|nr:hypothetical protein [Gemmatimonadota bacterium]
MSARSFIILSVLSSLLAVGPLLAGAWVQPHRGYFFKVAPTYLHATEEFDHRGDRQVMQAEQFASEDVAFTDFGIATYLEYGVRDEFTLVAQLPFKAVRSERRLLIGGGRVRPSERLHTVGFGDLSLALRLSLSREPLASALQVEIKIPSGYAAHPQDGPPLGSGELDGEVRFAIGKSLHPLPLYTSGELGYRRRGGDLNDEFLYAAEIGFSSGRLFFKLAVDGIRNTSTPPDIAGRTVVTPLPGGGGVVPELIVGDQHITKLNPAFAYSLRPGLALQIEALHAVAGTNSLAGTIYSLGILFTRK